LKVVYINTDTLWKEYEFVKITLKKLEREQASLQSTYESRTKKFEKDYNDYLVAGKAGSLTLQQQQTREEELTKQQTDIKNLEDEITQKLVVRKQTLNNEINDSILSFINRYRLANGYDMILQYAYLNAVLSATPELDVTEDVVAKLNKEYKKNKK